MSQQKPSGHPDHLGESLLGKKKKSVLLIVILSSVIAHVLGLGAFAVIKIVETVTRQPPEFEAIIDTQPTEPPPPPPTQRSTQRSMARPQPMAVANPLNIDVPSIEISETDMAMSLTGRGSGGGFGTIGGGAMGSLRLTEFGFDGFVEDALAGKLYDMKKDPSGKPIEYTPDVSMRNFLLEFTDKRFRASSLDREYFSSDKTLYGTHFVLPIIEAVVVPKAYNVEDQVEPTGILLHYTGTYTPTESGSYRFLGKADDCLIVAINKKIVLDASLGNMRFSKWDQNEDRDPGQKYEFLGFKFHDVPTIYGDWVRFEAGRAYDLDIVIGEDPGGLFGFYLMLEGRGKKSAEIFTTKKLDSKEKRRLRDLDGLDPYIP